MKKVLSILLVATLLFGAVAAFSSCSKPAPAPVDTPDDAAPAQEKTFTVGICQLGPHEALDAATQGFIDVLKAEFGDKVTFDNQNAAFDVSTCTTIANGFVSKKVDLILANATQALQAVANATDTIPVLGTSVTDYGAAFEIENFNDVVGGNISGTSDKAPLEEQAQMIPELFPDAKKVAILFCSSEANSRYQVDVVSAELAKFGIEVEECSFTDSNDVITAAQKAKAADVIYIPTDNTAANCATTIEGNVGTTPIIAGEEGICKKCGVATLSVNYYNLGKTTGEMAVKILKGEADISKMAIEIDHNPTKMFLESKCKELGIDTDALIEKGFVAINEEQAAD